jgi:hypothetical protein
MGCFIKLQEYKYIADSRTDEYCHAAKKITMNACKDTLHVCQYNSGYFSGFTSCMISYTVSKTFSAFGFEK